MKLDRNESPGLIKYLRRRYYSKIKMTKCEGAVSFSTEENFDSEREEKLFYRAFQTVYNLNIINNSILRRENKVWAREY